MRWRAGARPGQFARSVVALASLDRFQLVIPAYKSYNPTMQSPDGITWIGDRPAQIGALVTGADMRWTGDKLNPFEVYDRVEAYIEHYLSRRHDGSTGRFWREFMTTQRRIVLSSGLMWAVKYEGMLVKQLTKLISSAFITPRIYVLPVPENTLVGREANTKILNVCSRTQSFRDHVMFLGMYTNVGGDALWQAQPTPAEVLAIIDIVNKHASLSNF